MESVNVGTDICTCRIHWSRLSGTFSLLRVVNYILENIANVASC